MFPSYMNKPTFMNNPTNTSFGASTSTFGQPAANTSMFSSMQPSNIFQNTGTPSFNPGPTTQSSFGTNLFGQQPQPSTSGLFGSTNAFSQNKSFGFGSTPSQTGLFGQQPQQPTGTSLFPSSSNTMLFGSNAFGNQTTGTVIKFNPVTGTDTMQKNGVTQSISTKHHCITCMKEYENKSLEELRFEDYSCNRKGVQQQTGFGSTPFATATSSATPSLFGQTDNKQAFGQPQAFGQTPAFGQTTPAFGATNQTSTPNLFGKPNTFGATTSNTPTFGFNAAPTTNPFSSNQTQKPFSQPLFGSTTTQAQPTFGAGVFGQTNTQNTASNLFHKPAQPTTGFNAGQPGFSFNQTGTTQTSNLFQASKPNTGFGIFGQTNTGTSTFGQTSQPAFGSNFGKLAPTTFSQPTQPAFGTNLTGGLQQQPLFGSTASKPPGLFGNTTSTGGSLFSNNVFQQTPASFSLNMSQQQPTQFPPEPSDDTKNISLLATDSFPDGPFVYGLEPVLSDSSNSATNPQDIKALLDYSKKRDEVLGTQSKIKVHLPKPKRGSNYNKEFFEANQSLKNSHKCLVIRKFNDTSATIYNKYKNDLLEEAEECLKSDSEADCSTLQILTPRSFVSDSEYVCDPEFIKRRNLKLQFDTTTTDDSPRSNKSCYTLDASLPPLAEGSTSSLTDSQNSTPRLNGPIGLNGDETIIENDVETSSNNEIENTENPAGVILTRPEYYIYPALKDLHQYMDDNGDCVVQGLTIGRRGYGNVYFPDPINIANMNLDEIVHFRHREVIIYPDDSKKPPVGEGLNRRAQVTLDKIFPREKSTNNYITDISQIIQTNFVDNLMHVTQKHNCKFVDYRPKTGSWVFKVKHFSKYAFTDSDEEECEVSTDKPIRNSHDILKKLEKVEEVSTIGLGGGSMKSRYISESESFIAEPTLIEYWPQDDQYMYSEDIGHTDSAIQSLKTSLFINLDTPPLQEAKAFKRDAIMRPEEVTVPSEVISTPRVYRIPNISLTVLPEKITTTQRCYTELGIFRCNTYKVGWGKGFNFFNYDPVADNEIVYELTQCNISVENADSNYYNLTMPNLVDMLNITLDESEFTFDIDRIPTLRIKTDVTYLQKQTDLFNKHVRINTLSGRDKYLCSIWNLCFALWGPGDDIPCSRRQYVSDWLKKFTYDVRDEWSLDEKMDLDESEAFKTIFHLLSFHKITEACEFASKNNLNRLSLLISQMSANERVKFWMKKYIESLGWKEKDIVKDDFKKLYLLLSGIPIKDSINTCEDLDWMRSFGLHLWYMAPAAAPIDVAFNLYKKAFEELEYAVKPLPPYCDSESQMCHYDILYQILGLYVDSTYQLCKVLHPETHTKDVMDYRLSWFMLQLFQSLRVGLIRESEKDHLHTTFSNQLENMGQWKWAIFSLLFLENNIAKKNLIMRILDRNLSASTETEEIEKELVKTFKIPSLWIHEVKSTKAKISGRDFEYFQHCIYMENFQEASNTLVDSIAPELFINEQYDYLCGFISKLKPFSRYLLNWNAHIGLIEEFLETHKRLSGCGDEDIMNVRGDLGTFLRRVTNYPSTNDKQKLCIAELSRRCALLFKLLYKTLGSEKFMQKYAVVLSNLTMPPDIKHFEIFYLVTKYIQKEMEAAREPVTSTTDD